MPQNSASKRSLIPPAGNSASGGSINTADIAQIKAGVLVVYEQHSKPQLGMVLTEKKNKWAVLNHLGAELDLAPDRISALPVPAADLSLNREARIAWLSRVVEQAGAILEGIELEEAWSIFLGEKEEIQECDIAELLFPKPAAEHYFAVRRALLLDTIYFKRKKSSFEPRSPEIVEELKIRAQTEKEKEARREKCVTQVLARLHSPESAFDSLLSLEPLEQLAALGSSYTEAKSAKALLDEIIERAKLHLPGRIEDKAFALLLKIKHFTPDQDLTPLRLGRPLHFEISALEEASFLAAASNASYPSDREDCRHCACITIDGEDTQDFDDALSVEKIAGGFRFGIHISDVAAAVMPGSALEQAALRRATSIYTPDSRIPMLPREASENALSLLEGSERQAMSFFIETDDSYSIKSRRICLSFIRITKRLNYKQADSYLCQETAPPLINSASEIDSDIELGQALLHLYHLAGASETRRLESGAVQLDRREMTAKIAADGTITLEPANEDTPAHHLVSEMMILANETAALFAQSHKLPIVFRSQEPPENLLKIQDSDIPPGPAREYYLRGMLKRSVVSCKAEAHSGLGFSAYTQVTSPIRRAADIITQRQLARFISAGQPFYREDDITELLMRLEMGLDEAAQIQRERNRYWLLKYLLQMDCKQIKGVIVRVDGPKPLAELEHIYALFPFYPQLDGAQYSAYGKKHLGREVNLRIEKIDPRSLTLVLKEQ